MAESTVTSPEYVQRLSDRLRHDFPGAAVSAEHVRADRYRFVVVWPGFEDAGHPERQRRVWDVAEDTLDKSELFNASMIITLAPSELPAD